jgi:hypothetical protein
MPETMVLLPSSQEACVPEGETILLGQLSAELTLGVTTVEYRGDLSI